MTSPPVDTFRRVATQLGSTAKNWDREELIRCRSTGTDIVTEADLKGQAHPIFANWVETKPELLSELEQPILLASRILEAVGLPWLSDFLVDDVFDECYPGRQQCGRSEPIFAYQGRITPLSIVRHHQSSRATKELQDQWSHHAQGVLRTEFAKLIQWQIDEEMFQQRGWNGYTCRHPRGDLPLSELDRYETIKRFDSVSLHERSRNLTILVMAEYPARLAELRRQGKARGEEYLLTAFMTTVTILHELGHAIYWKDRRSLTRDLREPFYGADLEMELGDSFIAAIFGGWIPVPVREISRLQRGFTFADGIAWRQALSWDHHRMRPKYRAHYSIPVDYVARLFTEASWSTLSHRVTELIRPQLLTGNSNALRSVGLYMTLTRANQHATAAIADFHSEGHGSAWNRRPGAWFRISQFDGWIYPELELPIAGDDAICIPGARGPEEMVTARDPTPPDPSSAATVNPKGQRQIAQSNSLTPPLYGWQITDAEPSCDEIWDSKRWGEKDDLEMNLGGYHFTLYSDRNWDLDTTKGKTQGHCYPFPDAEKKCVRVPGQVLSFRKFRGSQRSQSKRPRAGSQVCKVCQGFHNPEDCWDAMAEKTTFIIDVWAFNNEGNGSLWPTGGEIDIIEGANTAQRNLFSTHTTPGCQAPEEGFTGAQGPVNCSLSPGNDSCNYAAPTSDSTTYGDAFNAEGGGVYALEWSPQDIKIWHFPRTAIPDDIYLAPEATLDPTTWGPPQALFGGSKCETDAHFFNMSLAINTNFCGEYAGKIWGVTDQCDELAPTCEEYVARNPSSFNNAFWQINYIDVYQKTVPINGTLSHPFSKNATVSKPAFSSTASTSVNTIPSRTRTITVKTTTTQVVSTPEPTQKGSGRADPATINGWALLGCFGSLGGYTSFSHMVSSGTMDKKTCIAGCVGRKYAGVAGKTCYCADMLINTTAVANHMCNFQCPGRRHESCGGVISASERASLLGFADMGMARKKWTGLRNATLPDSSTSGSTTMSRPARLLRGGVPSEKIQDREQQ
ncbi:hypothetical protein NUW58_g7148 [Xylaria curta]|uniref:Uncharacterized protein n=1 Tax=Xylaria curta TaxID=42375 RepID=A0ACC1NK42_9PEZI|nr:hypothetical protein NUW58_g7148 [Xylaria curta]